MKQKITITYCPQCGWLLQAAWMAQELLTTFSQELLEVALRPSELAGVFQIQVDDTIILDRKSFGGFPEPKVLKQLVRDHIAPKKSLGHSDEK